MGESMPAANIAEVRIVLSEYLRFTNVEIISAKQVDPDASIFTLNVDGQMFYVLEEDYIADLKWVITRFNDFGLQKPELQKLLSVAIGSVTETIDSYESSFQPEKLSYPLLYYLAKGSEI